MGFTRIAVRLSSIRDARGTSRPVQLLVDTGAAVTMVPGALLRTLGIKPSRDKVSLGLADGRSVRRSYADLYVHFRVNGHTEAIPTRVVFGGPTDAAVLGVPVLETAGYGVDPVSKKLVKVKLQVVALRA